MAGRVIKEPRPALGRYKACFVSGAIAGAQVANSPFFALQWADPVNLFVLRYFKMWFYESTFNSAQVIDLGAFVCRSFTAADSAGTASQMQAGQNKSETKMPDSRLVSLGDIRISATTKLTAGTRTPDTYPFKTIGVWDSAVGAYPIPDGDALDENKIPIVLGYQEGIEIQNITALAVTNAIKLYVDLGWEEVNPNTFVG